MAFNPAGTLLAIANSEDNTVSTFSVQGTSGITPVAGSPFPAGDGPSSVAFSPNGALLATANAGGDDVSMLMVGSSGALSTVPGSPFAAGSDPSSIAFSPYGGLLATANSSDNTVSVFSFSAAGTLTSVPGPPLATGSQPHSVTFSPLGGLLATANYGSDNVSIFSYRTGPPSASIASPANEATFTVGQPASATFSCSDAAYGPGLVSCNDSDGTNTTSGGTAQLATTTAGTFTYTVTATSKSGQTATSSIAYTVIPPTASAPAPITTTPAATPTAPTATISSLKTSGAVATLVIKCAGGAGQRCAGKVTLTSQVRKQGTKVLTVTALRRPAAKKITTSKVTLATATISVAAGSTSTTHIPLNPTGKKLLAELYELNTSATFPGTGLSPRKLAFAYPRVTSGVSASWHFQAAFTSVKRLVVSHLPRGGAIVVACRGGGCPFTSRRVAVKSSSATLTKLFAQARLAVGTRLTLMVDAPNVIGRVVVFTVRRSEIPKVTLSCLPPGDAKPVACHA